MTIPSSGWQWARQLLSLKPQAFWKFSGQRWCSTNTKSKVSLRKYQSMRVQTAERKISGFASPQMRQTSPARLAAWISLARGQMSCFPLLRINKTRVPARNNPWSRMPHRRQSNRKALIIFTLAVVSSQQWPILNGTVHLRDWDAFFPSLQRWPWCLYNMFICSALSLSPPIYLWKIWCIYETLYDIFIMSFVLHHLRLDTAQEHNSA